MLCFVPSCIDVRFGRFNRSLILLSISACIFNSQSIRGGQQSATVNKQTDTKEISAPQEAIETDSEKQERIAAERFLEILKKRPRAGTALDKVYGYHIQNGSLDKFCESLRTEAIEKSSGEAWMLLGMVHMQRGQDAEARVALDKAEELLPNEPLASYYLGKTLVLLGDVDKAAAALERSIERKPSKADMLLVFQELGRLYQRMRRGDDAMAVWNRMEKFFPGDTQVQEQIAVVLAEEGASAEALSRFETLAKTSKDRFRKVEMAMRAAQLKETVGRRDEALADFEKLLSQVSPDSWIHQDLRTRIDNVFLTRNDYDGLANYYTAWMEKNPDDIDAMLRIGRLLSVQRRSPEAKTWFMKAIERAPTNPAPRLALVDALERDREFGPAAEAMQALAEVQPDNPDTIVRWGELILNNRQLTEDERANAAAEVWKKLLDKRGEDPVTVSRVADLLRGANKTDEAIAAYRKAISLADNEPQYREYLGEFLFRLDRKDEALVVWRELASGPRESRENLVRLSEVLATFQLRDESLATMERVCADKPTFGQRARYAEMLRDATKYEEALKQLELAASIAESPEEHSLVIEEQLKVFQANGQLADRIAELEMATANADRENAKSWEKLSLYQEADRKFQQAAASIARAAELDPKSMSIQTVAVRVQEKAGMFGDAIQTLRKLSTLDRRYLSNYLTQIASLQMRLGQVEAALATGRELVSASSANSEQFKFFADLCLQAGKNDQGLDALRRNVRSNPNDREAIRYLARNLSSQFQTEEATELYWRAYMTSPTIEEKRTDVEAMVELYLRTNRFEQLVARLNTIGREENRQREATLLVAAAHQAAGDLGAARALLEPLLREESRDADLLSTLVKLSQAEFDWEAATAFQKRLNEVSPSPEGDYQLSRFLLEQGEITQAQAIWARMSSSITTTESVSQTIEKLMTSGETDKVVELAEQALAREPENWELLTVVMTALWRADKQERSVEVAERLIKMSLPFDTKSALAKKQQAQSARTTSGTASPANAAVSAATRQISSTTSRSSWLSRLSQNFRVFSQRSADPFGGVYFPSSSRSNPTMVYCFGDAQALAVALKQGLSIAKNPESRKTDEEIAQEVLESSKADEIWNALARIQVSSMYASNLAQSRPNATIPAADPTAGPPQKTPRTQLLERLYDIGDRDAPQPLLQTQYSLRQRPSTAANIPLSLPQQPVANLPKPDPLPALSVDELAKLEKLYEQTLQNQNAQATSTVYPLWLSDEFRLAKDDVKADKYLEDAKKLAEKNPASSYNTFLSRDRDFALALFVSSLDKQLQAQRGSVNSGSGYQTAMFVTQLIADSKEPAEFTTILQGLKKSQAAFARQQRPSQLVSYNPSQTINTNFSSNGQIVRLQVDFPAASSILSTDLLVTLRLLQQSTNSDLKSAIGKMLAEDAQAADEEVMQSAVDRLCFGSWLWWEDSPAAALEQMQEYRKLNVAPELGLVIESRMLFENKQIDGALALLESLKPMNQQMLQDRELAILQLVLQKGDINRAKESAERLFALRLDTATQMQVGELMMQLGMREMADSVLQRVRQRSGNDVRSQFSLMQKLQTMENKTAAVEIARQIIRRTQPSLNSNVRTTEDSYRRGAIQVLVAAGETKAMIASLEARLEKSPNTTLLIRQLAELYEASGKRKEAQVVLGKLAKSGSNDPQSLLAVARTLQQSGKHSEAVDAYLKALDKQPDLLNNEFYNLQNSVESAKKWKELAEGIERIGIKRFRQNYRFSELISSLMRANETEAARKLLKAWLSDAGLSALLQITTDIRGRNAESIFDDEIATLAVDGFIKEIQLGTASTFLFQTRSYSSNGQSLSLLTVLSDLLKGRDTELERLLTAVKSVSDSQPAMRVVEAALVAVRNDTARLDDLLPKILEESQQPNSRGLQGAWPLASALAHQGKMYQRAIDLLEPIADKLTERRNGNGIDYSPDGLMLYCHMQLKQNDKAKAILDRSVASSPIDANIAASNPGYGEYQLIQMKLAAAQKYVVMKYPLDALRLAIAVNDDKATQEKASRWSSNGEYFQRQLRSIEDQARRQITPEMLESILASELKVDSAKEEKSESGMKKASLQSLLIEVDFKESKSGKSTADCLLKQLLASLSKKGKGEEALKRIVTEAMAIPLKDRTLGQLIMLSCITIRSDDKEAFHSIANEIIAREESLAVAPAVAQTPSEKSSTDLDEKKKAAAQASVSKSARIERCGIWIAVEHATKLEQNELAERLAKLALNGFEPQSIDGQKLKLQFAAMQVAVGKKSEAEATLKSLLDELLPPVTQK